MPDRPGRRNPKHLKKLRRSRKYAHETNARAVTAPRVNVNVSVNGILTSLGLLVAAGILVLFAVSAWIEFREGLAQRKESEARSEQSDPNAFLPAVDPSTVEVRVLNGCGEPGAGREMTTHLRNLRFDVVSAGNADNFNYENTVVVNHTIRPEVGLSVAQSLGCSRLTGSPDEMSNCDVTVILGKDWSSFMRPPEPETPPPSPIRKIYSRARSLIGID